MLRDPEKNGLTWQDYKIMTFDVEKQMKLDEQKQKNSDL